MKKVLNTMMVVVAVALFSCHAAAAEESNDTIYFYSTWQQMLDVEPEAYIVNPVFYDVNPYEIYFDLGDEKINDMILEKYIAISQGDSIWLINSEYLKKNFKGDCKHIDGFAPVYFNDKTAFVVSTGPLTVKDVLFGTDRDGMTSYTYSYFYIDFLNQRVIRITHENLSKLLEDYHDLQMRYEGMKDYKKQEIIEDYFFKYIDRATHDFMHPYIVDLM